MSLSLYKKYFKNNSGMDYDQCSFEQLSVFLVSDIDNYKIIKEGNDDDKPSFEPYFLTLENNKQQEIINDIYSKRFKVNNFENVKNSIENVCWSYQENRIFLKELIRLNPNKDFEWMEFNDEFGVRELIELSLISKEFVIKSIKNIKNYGINIAENFIDTYLNSSMSIRKIDEEGMRGIVEFLNIVIEMGEQYNPLIMVKNKYEDIGTVRELFFSLFEIRDINYKNKEDKKYFNDIKNIINKHDITMRELIMPMDFSTLSNRLIEFLSYIPEDDEKNYLLEDLHSNNSKMSNLKQDIINKAYIEKEKKDIENGIKKFKMADKNSKHRRI